MTAPRLRLAALLLPLALGAAAAAAPPPPSADPADAVRRIYRDHQPWKKRSIDWTNPSVAAKYFDESLAALLKKDVEESEKRQDLPCLDFDPFLQAQDYDEAGITEPVIRDAGRTGVVAYEVSFTGKSRAWKGWNVRAVYVLAKTKDGWRVHDIEMAQGGSLRKLLACGEKVGAAGQ